MKSFELCVTTDILFGAWRKVYLPARLNSYGKKILLDALIPGMFRTAQAASRSCRSIRNFDLRPFPNIH